MTQTTAEHVTRYWRAWNPVTGCSERYDCYERCWARAAIRRFPQISAGRGFAPAFHQDRLVDPIAWHPERWTDVGLRLDGRPVVAPGLSGDVFDPAIAREDVAAIYGVMAGQPDATFLMLTKSVQERLAWHEWAASEEGLLPRSYAHQPPPRARLRCVWLAWRAGVVFRTGDFLPDTHGPWPLPHVWEGTSASTQADLDARLPALLRTPAARRWLSLEPLLGSVDLTAIRTDRWTTLNPLDGSGVTTRGAHGQALPNTGCPRLDLVIVGPETGPRRRSCDPAWIASVVAQCQDFGVRVLVKGVAS